jgi:hypothetical protein
MQSSFLGFKKRGNPPNILAAAINAWILEQHIYYRNMASADSSEERSPSKSVWGIRIGSCFEQKSHH